MKKRTVIFTAVICFLTGLAVAGLVCSLRELNKNKTMVTEETANVYFGDVSVTDYVIVNHDLVSAGDGVTRLKDLIEAKTGVRIKSKLKGGDNASTIRLIADKNYDGEKIIISDGKIILYGTDSDDLVKTVNAFANMYLGFSFAGEEREHILVAGDVYNSSDVFTTSTPWMEEREPIICLWKTNAARGQFYNIQADLNSEILTYSDDELYQYVKTMKACGFTGIQVTDMCSAWAQYSGYGFVHDRLRFMADAAHSLDMKFTLWVWGAEFNGYGWTDNSVVYGDYTNYTYSYECPEALATFEKYYDIYAELADCSDRVIMHFDDPSNLHSSEEVAYYAKLFKEKVKAINSDINFGISDYTDKYDIPYLVSELGTDTTIYSGAYTSGDISWKSFREETLNSGASLGVWSWNLCENEIDQLAQMNVNADLISSVYLNTSADGDSIMIPSYWSEMDSYHIANTFSLYVAGHLLESPGESAEDLLREVSFAVAGDEYGEDLYEILDTIQMARTGNTWDSFKWGYNDNYLLTSDAYPTEEILERCKTYGPKLDEMIEADLDCSTIPLAVSVSDLLHMVRTHLKQIEKFAEFRIQLDDIEEQYANGTDVPVIEEKLEEISTPIPNYDALLGVWGQPEALAQYRLLWDFCAENDLTFPENGEYKYQLKQLMYEEIVAYQRNTDERLDTSPTGSIIWEKVLGTDAARNIIDSLVQDGLLIRNYDDTVYLTNWEDYIFMEN